MSSPIRYEEVLRTARSLSESERIQLVKELLNSMGPDVRAPLDDSWLVEIDRRSEEIDSNTPKTLEWVEVRRRARDRAKLGD